MSQHFLSFLLFLVFASLPRASADLISFEHSDEFNAGHCGPWVLQSHQSSPIASPRLNMMKPFSACEDGSYLFLAPRGEHADSMPYILDSNGSLIWTADRSYGQVYNFQSQMYRGQRYLTFWAGDDNVGGHGAGKYYMLDQHYQEYRQIEAADGLHGDLHEFAITNDDTAVLTVYDPVQKDVSSLRSDVGEGYIWEAIFQELDLETGEAVFTWRASDHLDMDESYDLPNNDNSESNPWDWFHINSVDKDDKGNYLVSSRYLRSILYISGRTGEVLWRLGGKKNSFKDMSSGEATTFLGQHDARWDKNHKAITFFDNRADWGHMMDDKSRGIRILVDTNRMTAKLDQTFEHTSENILSTSQGSYRTLPNGHVILGYGVNGVISEYSKDGKLLCDAYLEPSTDFGSGFVQSYRNFKLPWTGLPQTNPSLVLTNETFYVSWLGSTEVKSWVLRHSDVSDTNQTTQFHGMVKFDRDGFETSYQLAESERIRRWVYVVALDAHDKKLAVSDAFDLSLRSEFWIKHGLLEHEEDLSHTDSEVADEYYSPEEDDAEEYVTVSWPNPYMVMLVAVVTIIFIYSFVHFGWGGELRSRVRATVQRHDLGEPINYQRVGARRQITYSWLNPSVFSSLFRSRSQQVPDAEQYALFDEEILEMADDEVDSDTDQKVIPSSQE